MSSKEIIQKINDHIRSVGGAWNIPEADTTLNDLNRELLAAMKNEHGELYLGSINCYNAAKKLRILDGMESIYEELKGQMVYNFSCDFAVPCKDSVLENLVRAWNANAGIPSVTSAAEITNRVEAIGGVNLIWT